jgi:type I site-specific restriction-modification system R (restriction) subunit
MTKIFESTIEEWVIELLQQQGFEYLAPEEQEAERVDLSEVVLRERLRRAIEAINPGVSPEAREQALRMALNLPSQNLMENNEAFHRMLTEGIEVEVMGVDGVRGEQVWLVDFSHPERNEFLVCNQYTVIENGVNKRPDVVILVNGVPLVVIELKNPADEHATVHKAFTQLQNYKQAIPSLFAYNALLVASDGLDARGSGRCLRICRDFSRGSLVTGCGKTVLALDNPTVVVITDRNDLDDQLFDTFANCKQLLRQEPVQAKSREDLKRLLRVAGGGIVRGDREDSTRVA